MRPSLQLKISQHLALTPQLQQSIRLLQLSSLELQQELNQMLADNPLLEMIEPVSEDEKVPTAQVVTAPTSSDGEFANNDEPVTLNDTPVDAEEPTDAVDAVQSLDIVEERGPAEEWPSSPESGDDDEQTTQQAGVTTLREYLLEQTSHLRNVDDDTLAITRLLIEAVDESGFLTMSREELNFLLAQESGTVEPLVSESLWNHAIAALQSLDPVGVGARNLRECLVLQIAAMPETVAQIDALEILRNHYDSFIRKDSGRIKRALHMEDEDLRAAVNLIQSVPTRPCSAFGDDAATFVVPDVIVKKTRNRWMVQLNPSTVPKLRLNEVYASILSANKAGRTTPMSAQLQEARWMIRNVEQRFATILRVTQTIVNRQSGFFDHGDIAMRPLTLREIADELDLHESTISRVTSAKYMASPRGVFELKYFFGSGVATDTGGAASATAIKAMIKQMVGAEDPKKPLTDNTLAELLEAQGVLVARRTVAKYREMLGIGAVSARRVSA
jgi:RNA polymerase sigma-54 factor